MSLFRKQLSVALSFLLAVMLLPVGVSPAFADEGQSASTASWSGDIPALLAAGDYTEGEALVIMSQQDGSSGYGLRSIDLLDSAEPLMDVTPQAYETSVAESGVQDEAVAYQSLGNADAPLTIRLVKQLGMSTEEYEADPLIMRSISMETLPQPGDVVAPVKPNPTPIPGGLASTGDGTVSLVVSLVLGGLVALGAVSMTYRRFSKRKECHGA